MGRAECALIRTEAKFFCVASSQQSRNKFHLNKPCNENHENVKNKNNFKVKKLKTV
jgi:hypothetical protein